MCIVIQWGCVNTNNYVHVTGALLSGPGAMEEAIYKQSKLYAASKEEQQKGLKVPQGDIYCACF